jgi:GNAT superfamily N-acetyltransferase
VLFLVQKIIARRTLRIVKKKYAQWRVDIKRRLRHATLSGGYLRKYMLTAPNSLTIVAFSRKQITGWVFILSIKGENTVNTFVNKRYRNRGIATYLIEQTLYTYPRTTLCQWNDTTKAFFRKLSKKHPGRIKVIDWWKSIGKYQKIVEKLSK